MNQQSKQSDINFIQIAAIISKDDEDIKAFASASLKNRSINVITLEAKI